MALLLQLVILSEWVFIITESTRQFVEPGFFPKQGFFAKQIHCLEFSWTKQVTMFSFRCGGRCYVVAKSRALSVLTVLSL